MSLSNSCSRCQQPLAVESAGGLCDVCSKALETSRESATPHSPQLEDATVSRYERDVGAKTLLGGATAGTGTWDGEIRLRPAPIGYDLFRHLGGGGMGDVYLAREHTSERMVAIKFLRSTHNAVAIDRFLTEVRALGRIEHPHIVRALATDFNRSDPFFTMEFVAGGTLTDRVKANGPLASIEAARVIASAARAVHAGHAANVLHRDIKPSNILIAADGTPRVSDFGLAKRTDRDDENTQGSGPLGTPSFMPPEQVSRKHGEIGPHSDVYGLGATLYYLVTGQAPFSGDSASTIISHVTSSVLSLYTSQSCLTPSGFTANSKPVR